MELRLWELAQQSSEQALFFFCGSSGGTIVTGGEADVADRYQSPTVVVDPELDSALMQEANQFRRRLREPLGGPHLPRLDADRRCGPSGMGSYHGKAGFDVFSHHKSVLRKPPFPGSAILYPP